MRWYMPVIPLEVETGCRFGASQGNTYIASVSLVTATHSDPVSKNSLMVLRR